MTKIRFRFKNLSFKFDAKDNYFFHNINLTFQSRTIYTLHGQNGAGKSTLFRLLHGSLYANEVLSGYGYEENNQFDLSTIKDRLYLKTLVNYVPQKPNLLLATNLTGFENLQLTHIKKIPTLGKLPNSFFHEKLINQFCIDLKKPIELLSGGQQQLLTILMALQNNPKLLLLDEPTAALDPKNTTIVLEFLDKLVEDTSLTIFMISHHEEIIKKYHENKHELLINQATQQRFIAT